MLARWSRAQALALACLLALASSVALFASPWWPVVLVVASLPLRMRFDAEAEPTRTTAGLTLATYAIATLHMTATQLVPRMGVQEDKAWFPAVAGSLVLLGFAIRADPDVDAVRRHFVPIACWLSCLISAFPPPIFVICALGLAYTCAGDVNLATRTLRRLRVVPPRSDTTVLTSTGAGLTAVQTAWTTQPLPRRVWLRALAAHRGGVYAVRGGPLDRNRCFGSFTRALAAHARALAGDEPWSGDVRVEWSHGSREGATAPMEPDRLIVEIGAVWKHEQIPPEVVKRWRATVFAVLAALRSVQSAPDHTLELHHPFAPGAPAFHIRIVPHVPPLA